MGVTEKLIAALRLTESKKDAFGKSVAAIVNEIKDMEGNLGATQTCYRDCLSELERRERDLVALEESIVKSCEELNACKEFVEKRSEELEGQNREFYGFMDGCMRCLVAKTREVSVMKEELIAAIESRQEELNTREKLVEGDLEKLEMTRESLEDREKWIGLKEKSLMDIEMQLEEMSREIALEKNNLEDIRKQIDEKSRENDLKSEKLEELEKCIDERSREIEFKQKKVNDCSKELDRLSDWIEKKMDDVDLKEGKLKECMKVLEAKEEDLELTRKKFEMKEKNLVTREKEVDMKEKKLEAREKEIDVREKKLEAREKEFTQNCFKDHLEKKKELQLEQASLGERIKDLASREKGLTDKLNELESREKQVDDQCKKCEIREKQVEDGLKELEMKKIQLNVHVKPEPVEYVPNNNNINCSSAYITLNLRMDGKDLQVYLNEREKDHDTMADEVYTVLQLSRDPAKLVLDAMEGFYPPHTRKGDVEFDACVIRRSCILLLEQLTRISPKVRSRVKVDAIEIANAWKSNIRTTKENLLEVLGSLHLLVAYGISQTFNEDELLSFLKIVGQQKQIELLRILGLTDKVPGFIQDLIQDGKCLEAVNIVYAFELVETFQPVSLLKNFVHSLVGKEDNCDEEQSQVISSKKDSIRAVIKCIRDHKLEDEYSPAILEQHIQGLAVKKADDKCDASAACNKIQEQGPVEMQIMSQLRPTPVQPSKATAFTPSHDMAVILGNMGGKYLQHFLIEHMEEHELLRNEIFSALQKSPDPSETVLDAIQEFSPSYLRENSVENKICSIKRSWIFLLEQLMRLSPKVKAEVKEKASKLAFDWIVEIRENGDPVVVLGFLLLVASYYLVPLFNKDELLNLYCTISQHKHAAELGQALGISDKISNIRSLDSQAAIPQNSAGNIMSCTPVSLPCLIPKGDNASFYGKGVLKEKGNNLESGEVPSFFHSSLDPAKIVLDALKLCYQPNMGKIEKPLVVKKSFVYLLEHLMTVSPVIRHNVREAAKSFSVEWKARLTASCPNTWDALGFLQFVAAYKVSSSFSADELIPLFKVVFNQPKKVVNLLKVLGLADEIPGFIKDLIQKKQNILAISYICESNLADMFPPRLLLKNHMLYVETLAKSKCNNRFSSSQLHARVSEQISALRAVINCITRYRLETEFSPDPIKARAEELERQIANIRTKTQALGLAAKKQEQDRKRGALLATKAETQVQDTQRRPSSAANIQGKEQVKNEVKKLGLQTQLTEQGTNNGATSATEAKAQQTNGKKRPAPEAPKTRRPRHRKRQATQDHNVRNPGIPIRQNSDSMYRTTPLLHQMRYSVQQFELDSIARRNYAQLDIPSRHIGLAGDDLYSRPHMLPGPQHYEMPMAGYRA